MRTDQKIQITTPGERGKLIVFFIILSAVFAGATWYTGFSPVSALTSQGEFWRFILVDFLPPRFMKIDQLAKATLQTFTMAVASTGVSAVIAFFLSFMGSSTICAMKPLNAVVRAIASVLRNIPTLVWAFILVAAFGIGTSVGVLALMIATVGFLVRAFIETIDEVAEESIEALRATGAGTLAVITQSIIPAALPGFISWFLYCIETNIRASTILGMVGAGGIGLLMTGYIKQYNYHAASAVILAVAVMIIAVNLLTEYLRSITLG